MTSLINNTSYKFEGTHNDQTDGKGNRLGYFSVADGTTVAIQDNVYQQFTQDSIVVDFKIKAKPTHNTSDGYKARLRIMNGGGLNTFKVLYVDKDGYLYTENNNEKTRIDGYRLDGETWLNISVVAIKNVDNAGKFGSFKASTANSTSDNSYYFNYYINGNYVGTNPAWSCFEWGNGYGTASNHSYVITDYTIGDGTPALDPDALKLTLVDDTTTANHQIWKSADGLTYYDITFENGVQTKYSAMVLTRATTEDSIRFFTDATFEGAIDNIAVYAGTAPKSAYENANSASGGALVNVDFASHVFPSVNNTSAMTRSSGADALGTFVTSGIATGKSVRRIDESDEENPISYSTISFASGNHFNFFVPMPEKVNGVYDFEYSFETTVKNIVTSNTNTPTQAAFRFFSNRFEVDGGTNASAWLMSVDSSGYVYGGSNAIKLYNEDGTRAQIDNANWNTLRGDIHYYQNGSTTAFEFSYYLGGELLYLEDGSPAYRIVNSAIASDAVLALFGVNNYRVRYTQATADVSIDVKSITISANAKPIYNKVTSGQANINDNVTVIELKVPKYTSNKFDGVYDLLSLTKTSAGKEYRLPVLTVNPYTSKVSIGMLGVDYELCDFEGNAYTVGNTPLSVAIVYNDIYGKARYYVDGTAAYINLGGKLTAAAELLTDDPTFANLDNISTAGYVLFGGCGIGDDVVDTSVYKLNTYNVNDGDTAEIVGFQSNSITDGLRIIAGVDTRYYNKVGFEMETFIGGESKGLKDISHNEVFSSVVANDKTLPAQSQGYNFFAAGFEPSNGGRFGTYGTLMTAGEPKNPYPWDCVFVFSNIKIVDAGRTDEDWMNDHAIVWAELEIN